MEYLATPAVFMLVAALFAAAGATRFGGRRGFG
jgi:hypothetical protein